MTGTDVISSSDPVARGRAWLNSDKSRFLRRHTHLDYLRHFLLVDASIAVDVVEAEGEFQLLLRLARLRDADRLQTTTSYIIPRHRRVTQNTPTTMIYQAPVSLR